jgi:UDP-N-acetylmuramate--alanine ligase
MKITDPFKIEDRKVNAVHFMGIGGSGASAVASIAEAQGFMVTGCDTNIHSPFIKHFSHDQISEGFSPDHLLDEKGAKKVDILAISPAIPFLDPDSKEMKKAEELGIEVLTWQEFMGKYLEEDKFVIAVCGTHGKSTTTAMIAHVLEEAGLDPTVEIGAIVSKWGKNYRVGKSKYFVTEADEFNNNFLVSHPDITLINNLDMDHPEFYKDFEDYIDSFDKFLMQNKGTIVANLEDKEVAELLKWVMKHSSSVCIDFNKNQLQLDLKVPGEHNKKNALAAFQVGLLLGIEPLTIIQALNSFTGLERRQELLGEKYGARIYSDYAVHPVEIEKTTEAIKSIHPDKKIWVIFQPHMFSRTKALFNEFVEVFKRIEVAGVVIVDIYASRDTDPGDMNSKMLVEAINRDIVAYEPKLEDVLDSCKDSTSSDDVIIFYGAGDIDKVARNWVKG